MRRTLIGMSREVEYELRNDVFRHLTRLAPSYFQRHRTGDIMSRATNDLSNVRMVLGPGIMYAANTGVTFVATLAFMVRISPRSSPCPCCRCWRCPGSCGTSAAASTTARRRCRPSSAT
jgi:ATP-binding cassette subfamily B protein